VQTLDSVDHLLNYPSAIFTLSVVLLSEGLHLGVHRVKKWPLKDQEREALWAIFTATLTVLGLIIGFSFSMAVSRHDQRKNYEAAEANAIGTEYRRAELLPTATADTAKGLLRTYLDQRIEFYEARDENRVAEIGNQTDQLEERMWAVVQSAAAAQPTPVVALVTSGMNDVLNSRGYTQAAWWNRIPAAGWILMAVIALGCSVLMGFITLEARTGSLMILPVMVSIAFFLIAEIDSPRHGVVRVLPRNLTSLAESLHAPLLGRIVPKGELWPENSADSKQH
jgi:hypothetical protein